MSRRCPTPPKLTWLRSAWLCALATALPWAWAQTAGVATGPQGDRMAARFAAPAQVYDTPGLAPGRVDATRNDELEAALRALVGASGSGQVRWAALPRADGAPPLAALHFSRGPGRPLVALLGQQHGNEPAPAEALLVVARQLADPGSPLAAVLDAVDVFVLPRLNPDGAELDRRGNALGLDVNRDHLLLHTPEARALAQWAASARPVLVADLHEFSASSTALRRRGAIKRPDLLLQYSTTPNLPAIVAAASDAWFRPALQQALAAEGLVSDWYHVHAPDIGPLPRLRMGGLQPELLRNASGLRHAVSFLIETRGLGLGRQYLTRRVHSHVVAVSSLLRSAAARAPDLQGLQQRADAEVVDAACQGDIVVEAAMHSETRDWLLVDMSTGEDMPLRVEWESALDWRALTERTRPCGYWLAASETEAVARLRLLGLQVRQLEADTALQVQRYQETARGNSVDGEDAAHGALAGRRPLRLWVALSPGRLQAPAGSYYVGLDQPLAALAQAALEPDSGSSYVTQRLLRGLDRLARVVAPPPFALPPAAAAPPGLSAASAASVVPAPSAALAPQQ